jgi:uncharacterized protein (DUF885 family)
MTREKKAGNQAVADLAAEYWDFHLESHPTRATLLGDHRYDHLLEEISEESSHDQVEALSSILRRTREIDPTGLDHQDRLTREILISEAEDQITLEETRVLVAPVDQFGVHSLLLIAAGQVQLSTPEQAEAILERYSQVPRLLDQLLSWHRLEAGTGRSAVAANLVRVIAQLDAYLATPVESDPFAATPPPPDWSGSLAWKEALGRLARDAIRPAYARYREGLVEHVKPMLRPDDRPGLCHVPDGDGIYRRLMKVFTSTPLDPADLHRIGYRHATETLPADYVRLGRRALGVDSFEGVISRLRSGEGLRFGSAEEIVAKAREVVTRSWAAAPAWFGLRPESPCRVEEIPEALAPNLPPAYYYPPATDGSRPGTYFVNTHQPESKNRYEAEAVGFHEAIPGHHFQLALSSELQGLPEFRRHALMTAYVEGWGLYTELLADEMGLYSSEIDRLGMLSADSWRAGRLVVDTGIHSLGWTRSQAVEFLERWSAVGSQTISQEVDRYIGMPGQALAYKVGQREILRLRELARTRLGERFDIRDFHDVVLGSGPVTLPMLAELVEDWIGRVASE